MLTRAFTQVFPAAFLQTQINSGSLVHRHFFQAVFPLLLTDSWVQCPSFFVCLALPLLLSTQIPWLASEPLKNNHAHRQLEQVQGEKGAHPGRTCSFEGPSPARLVAGGFSRQGEHEAQIPGQQRA